MGCLTILIFIGLALFGGASLVTPSTVTRTPETPLVNTIVFSASADATDEQLQAAADVIDTRLATLEIAHDVATSSEGDARMISVSLPTLDDYAATVALIQQPGYLELVDLSGLYGAEYHGATIWTSGQAARLGAAPPDGALLHPQTGEPFETIIDGTMVRSAAAILSQYGQWVVQVEFDDSGAETLASFTAAHIGEPLAIVVDGNVFSAPSIMSEISGGTAVIQGNLSEQEARTLATQIGSGSAADCAGTGQGGTVMVGTARRAPTRLR